VNKQIGIAIGALAFLAGSAFAAAAPDVPVQAVITARPAKGAVQPTPLEAGELTVTQGKTVLPVTQLQRLPGPESGMQLYILLDDSTRSSSLGLQLPELKNFIQSLPAGTQVAAGYMRNGSAVIAQPFTTDHAKAASSLRLPNGLPGENGSPYFVLSDLSKHWPSKEPAARRVVLMLTDGVDRYYGSATEDDPYVDAAIHDSLKRGILVYSIYLRGAGLYGRGNWLTTLAQSRLIQTSDETGGHAYYQDTGDPVSIDPFLRDFRDRLANQYSITFKAANDKGVHSIKFNSEQPSVKIEGPSRIYIP
jgi:hypothetical protein